MKLFLLKILEKVGCEGFALSDRKGTDNAAIVLTLYIDAASTSSKLIARWNVDVADLHHNGGLLLAIFIKSVSPSKE